MREILEHSIGKPSQEIKTDISNNGLNITPIEWVKKEPAPDLSWLTDEELEALSILSQKIESSNLDK